MEIFGINEKERMQYMRTTESFVKENTDSTYLIYEFENDSCPDETGFRAMKSTDGTAFLKNSLSIFNRRLRLIYNTDGCISAGEYLKKADRESIRKFYIHFLENAEKISENVFMSFENILTSPDRIYICINTGEVRFVYIPSVSEKKENESELCRILLKELFAQTPFYLPETVRQKANSSFFSISDIKDAFINADENKHEIIAEEQIIKEKSPGIFSRRRKIVRDYHCEPYPEHTEMLKKENEYVLFLNGFNGCEQLSFGISDSAVIGRNESRADHIISNSVVSSAHCRIYKTPENEFYVADLGSTNGTAVNSSGKLKPHTGYKLNDGDMLHISRISLEVSIKKKEGFKNENIRCRP